MEIVFKRRLMNELLTTYLPSFLLLSMCYATTYFKPFYFEAAVTVNLSILLVTTTLFIRYDIYCVIVCEADLEVLMLSVRQLVCSNVENSD